MRQCRTADSSEGLESSEADAGDATRLRDPADRSALLWILGTNQGPRPQSARLVPSRNHGGYKAPSRTHRGAPPAWSEQLKVGKLMRPQSSRAERKPQQDLALELPPDGEPVGSHCSFIERCKGRRVRDGGAMHLELRADKGCKLVLGDPAADTGPPAREAESRIQAMMPRPESGGPHKRESKAWARRRKAADIISALHERTVFADIKAHLERKALEQLESSEGGHDMISRSPSELRRQALLRRQREVRATMDSSEVQASPGSLVFVQVVKAMNLSSGNGTDAVCVAEVAGKDVKRQMTVPQRPTSSVRSEEVELCVVESTDAISFKVFQREQLIGSANMKGSEILSRPDFKEDIKIILKNEEATARRMSVPASVTVHVRVAGQPGNRPAAKRGSFKKELRKSFFMSSSAVQEEQLDVTEIREHQEQLLHLQPVQKASGADEPGLKANLSPTADTLGSAASSVYES